MTLSQCEYLCEYLEGAHLRGEVKQYLSDVVERAPARGQLLSQAVGEDGPRGGRRSSFEAVVQRRCRR